MKCRRVKPKPWEVRRKCTVFGLGHENASSSVGYCPTRESAKLLHSGESFCREKNVIISISVRKSHLLNISNEYIYMYIYSSIYIYMSTSQNKK